MRRCTIPQPAKPQYLYHVTSDEAETSIQEDDDGNFDTGIHVTGPWDRIVTITALDDHLRRQSHHQESSSSRRPPHPSIFISVLDDQKGAAEEHLRSILSGRRGARLVRIDVLGFEWEYVHLGENTRFPVLRSSDWHAAFFSTDSATQALNWWDHRMNSKEWFAVAWIPGSITQSIGTKHGTCTAVSVKNSVL